MSVSFVDELTEVVDYVEKWASELIDEISSQLLQDGAPFGASKISEQEQLNQYLQLRGNPDLWATYINTETSNVINKLTQSGISQDKIASIHPYNLVIMRAIKYSKDMEALLNARSNPNQ